MRFRKKAEVVEAVQWNGSNWHLMLEFCGRGNVSTDGQHLFLKKFVPNGGKDAPDQLQVPEGSWVVKHARGVVFEVLSDRELNDEYEPLPD